MPVVVLAQQFTLDRATCARHSEAGVFLAGNTTTGAPGTYNYLIDAILAVPRTRQMYMRRLRTLMDQFIASGRLQVRLGEVALLGCLVACG